MTKGKTNNTLLKITLFLLIGLVSFGKLSAQYSGTITLPSGNFTGANALRDLIDSLNAVGLSGNLTVNVTTAYTAPTDGFSLGSAALNGTMGGKTLTFEGAGNVITAPVGTRVYTTTVGFSGNFDFIWCIRGTDNVTINNFIFTDPSSNTTTTTTMESAITLFNLGTAAPMDGCQNIRLTNNVFNLSNLNGALAAIQAIPFTRFNATANTWADFDERHRDFTITGNTMNQGNTFFRCRSNTTNVKMRTINVSNNTLNNVGSPSSSFPNAAYGIWMENTDSIFCRNNTIIKDSTHTTGSYWGIWLSQAFGRCEVTNNTILLRKGQSSSNTSIGILVQPNGSSAEAVATEVFIRKNTIRIDSIFSISATTTVGTWTGITLSSPMANNSGTMQQMRCIVDSNIIENSVLQGSGNFTGFQLNGNSSTGNPARTYFVDNIMRNIRRNAMGSSNQIVGVTAQSFVDSIVISRNIFDNIRCDVLTASSNNWNCIPIWTTNMTSASPLLNVIISNNTVSNIFVTGLTTSGFHQIGSQIGGFRHQIFNNRIRNCYIRATPAAGQSGGGTILGLFITANSPGMQIYNNVLDSFHVSNSNALSNSGSIFGINVQTTGTFDIYNNYMGDFFTPHTNTTNGMFGININTASVPSVFNIYNNTIRFGGTGILTAPANTSAFGGAGIFYQNSTTASIINLKNNIIDINATPGTSANWACVKRSSGSHGTRPVNFLSSSSNNTYRINSGMQNYYYCEGTSTSVSNGYAEWTTNGSSTNDALFDGACSAYKGFMQGEAATVSNAETWVAGPVANTFRPSGSTISESSADPIALVTTDLNGAGRGATPDRGALQFSGTGTDIFGPRMSFLDIPTLFCVTNPALSVEISDMPSTGSINTTSGTRPRLYFKKSTETNTFTAANTSAGNGWKWVEASNTSSPFVFNFDYSLLNSAAANGNVIEYFIIAQDNVGTANVSVQGAALTGGCPTSVNIAGTAAITGATNTKSFAINTAAPPYGIEHTPVTSCQGDTLQLRVIIDSSAAVMRTYTGLTGIPNSSTGWADIDTFVLGNNMNVSGCTSTGVTPGAAGNGLPASIVDRYSNYVTSSLGSLTDLFAGTSVNFRMTGIGGSATGGSISTTATSQFAMYIDYNRNGVLESPAELVNATPFTVVMNGTTCQLGIGNVAGSFSVPTNIVSGPTLCRVMFHLNLGSPITSPTQTSNWGEVEDYIVSLKGQPDPNFSTHAWTTNKTGTSILSTQNPTRLPSFDTTTIFTDTLNFVGCKLPITKSITVNPSPRGLRTFGATQCGPGIPPTSFRVRDSNAYTFPVIEWYASAVGGSPLQQGLDTVYLNPVNATTTLFVRVQNPGTGCWSARSPITLTVTASDSILGRANGVRDTFRTCQGPAINLTALNVQAGGATKSFDTFTWSGNISGVSFPLKNTTGAQTITPSAGGIFRIFVDAIDTGSGCKARDTVVLVVQTNPFAGGQAFISAAPNPACAGTPITHTLRMANALATMPTYTLGTAPPSNPTLGWLQIDTFQLDNFLSSANCVGITPAAGPAANGLPASTGGTTGGFYQNYTSATALATLPAPPVLRAGATANYSVKLSTNTTSSTGWGNTVSIFIDYNRNGIIDPTTERVVSSPSVASTVNTTCTRVNEVSGTITIPNNIVSGPALMRVMTGLNNPTATSITNPNANPNGMGETEDYVVTLIGAADTNINKLTWTSSATGAAVLGTNHTLVHPVTVNNQRYNVRMVNGLCIDSLKDTISTAVPPLNLNTINGTTSVCFGETVLLSVTSTGGCIPHTYVWSMLSGAGTFANQGTGSLRDSVNFTATGATGARTVRCIVTDNAGNRDTSDHVLSFNNPTPSAVVKDTICGLNSAVLCATSSVTSDVLQWFSSPTSFQTLAEGNCYTTPALNQQTVFFVRQFTSVLDSCEPRSTMVNFYTNGGAGAVTGQWGSRVRATKRVIVKSVEIIPSNASASPTTPVAGTVNVGIYDLGGNLVGSSGVQKIDILNSNSALASALPSRVPMGILLPPGDYLVRLISLSSSVTNVEYAQNATGTNFQPQFTPSGSFGVLNGQLGATVYLNYNFTFWNFVVEEGCWGAPTPDTVMYQAPPILTLSRRLDSVCSLGATTPVTLTSPSPPSTYNRYTWTPSTAIAGDSAAGYIFSETAPAMHTYVLSANQTTGLQCATTDTFRLLVKPIPPVISRTPATASVDLCNGTVQQLDALGFRMTNHVVGTATTTGTAAGQTPFMGGWGGTKSQFIILASELPSGGTPKTLKSIAMRAVTSATTYEGFQIYVGHTTLTSFTAANNINPITGAGNTPAVPFTRVYEANAALAAYTPIATGGGFNNTFPFGTKPATPLGGAVSDQFLWDGTSNIVVFMSWSENPTAANSTASSFEYSNPGFNATFRHQNDNQSMADMAITNGGTSGVSASRPNMQLLFEDGAPITWSPTTSLFTNSGASAAYTGTVRDTVYARPVDTIKYFVTATFPNGCTRRDSITLNIKDTITINSQPPSFAAFCSGDTMRLCVNATSTSPITYQWKKNGLNISSGVNPSANSSCLVIPNSVLADSGTYEVDMTTGAPCSGKTSIQSTVKIRRAIIITTQPKDTTVCVGSPLAVVAAATNDTARRWTQIGGSNTGTNNTYSTASSVYPDSGRYFITYYANSPCLAVNSDTVRVKVLPPAMILADPATLTNLCIGDSVTLKATHQGALGFQWLKNGSPIAGATSDSLKVKANTQADSGIYRMIVFAAVGCTPDTSAVTAGIVKVNLPISIVTQPLAKTFVCQNSAFNAGITAQNVTAYQWKKDGTNVSIGAGGTTANYSIASTQPADAGIYTVEMVGISPCPNVISTNDTLQVTKLAAITTQPSAFQVCEDQPISISGAGSDTASHQWLFNGSPISAPNGTRQTYTKGGSPATMADSGMYRLVLLSANAGATVCKADTSIAVLGAVVRKIAITTQPLAKTFVCQNSAFNAGITAQNVTSYQWKKDGTNVSTGTGGTTANYSIASTQPADAGIYTVEMVGISPCPNVISTNDTLQVTRLAAITTQPSAFQVCEDQPISISGAGSDTASHQWLFNGSPISAPNGTRQTYTKGGSPATMADSGMYRLVLLSANAGATVCKADTSIAVLGAVVRKIAITTQPLAKTFVCQNSAFNAGITAQNVTSYQWKKDGTNVSTGTGGTTANYSIASTQPSDAGIFTVEMVGISPCPNVTSTNDTLQVTTLAAITTPPASGTVVCEAQGFTLNTAATNAASYQWLRNGAAVGTSSTAYSIASATMTDSAFYRVVALSSNAGATVCKADTSAPVLVTVNRAIVINTQPASFSYGCIGASFNLNVVTQNAAGFSWIKNGTPNGQTTPTMTINPFGYSDTGNYTVVITGRPSCPNVISNNAKVDPTTAAFVTVEPANTDVCLNDTLKLSVIAQAAQTYQWRKNGVNIPGAVSNTYNIPNAGFSDAANYDVIAVAYFGCTNDTSRVATVVVSTPLAITTPIANSDVKCEGQNISYTTGVSGTSPYTYAWKLNGSTVGTNNATYSKSNILTADSGQYIVSIMGSPACPMVYDTLLLDVNKAPVVNVDPNGASPICIGSNSTLNVTVSNQSSIEWHKVGAGNTGQTGSTFNFTGVTNTDGGSYFVIARAQPACSDVTSSQVKVAINAPASIALNPLGSAILEDPAGNYTMNVIAAGSGPFTYQWFRQGNPILGATSASYSITNYVPTLDSGSYYCRVTAPAPCSNSVNSTIARVTTIKCPAVVKHPIKTVNICSGGAFSLDVTATGVKTYQWFKGNAAIPGATFANFSIPKANPSHTGVYRCRLFAFNDATCDITYSDSAVVTVKDQPIITQQPAGITSCAVSTHTMTVAATFGETYQWYRNGIAISPNGDGPSYTYNNVNLIGDEFYVKVGNNLCPDANSDKVVLKNVNPSSQVYLAASTVFNLVERCNDANGWTYYSTSAQSEQLLMAIKKKNNVFTARPDIELMGNIREISPLNKENRGAILGTTLFNLDITGQITEPYELKFYYSKADADQVVTRFNQIRLANASNFSSDITDLTFVLSTQQPFTSSIWKNLTIPLNIEHTVTYKDKEFGVENNVNFVILKNLVSTKLGGTAFMDYRLKSSSSITSTTASGFGFSLYPVPSTDGKLTVDVSSKRMKPITFTVTDMTGRVVAIFNEKHTSLESSHAFDFSQLASGNYQMMISNDEESAIGKFTISK
jgi:DNA mismatch repair protein MutH